LAAHWVDGGAVSWGVLYDGRPIRRVRLPVYPFDRQPFWVQGGTRGEAAAPADTGGSGERRIRDCLTAMLGEALGLPPDGIAADRHLYDFGIDSILAMKLLRGVAQRFGLAAQMRDLVAHPTIATLARHLAGQLAGQLDGAPERPGTAAPLAAPLAQTPRPAGPLPLSEGQAGLWTLQQLAPGMSAYNIPLCFHITGPIEPEALERAFRHVLEQHPVLTSRFGERNGGLVREVGLASAVTVEREDVGGLDPAAVLARVRETGKVPFDLGAGPLARLHLFRRGPRDHYLLLTLHHIVFDGGSFLPVCRTLFRAYQEILRGGALPAAADDAYADFVRWQREMLSGPQGRRHRAYWTQQLAGDLPVLALSTDFPRAAGRRFAGQSLSIRLEPALDQRLRAFARQQRMNLSTLFLALYTVVLHRYTGQDDIIVGMPEQGRAQERFARTVGYFINMLPIRARGVGGKPFAELLRELQLTMADALDHAAYPFPALVRDLGIAPSEEFAPVFQVAFEYQNAFSRGDLLAFNGEFRDALSVELVEEIGQEGEYELVLEVRESPDDTQLTLKFNPTLFRPATVAAMAGHLVRVAEQAVADPRRPPAELDPLTVAERRRLVEEWNDTRADYPAHLRVDHLVERQARATPDAVAVLCGDARMTYAELEARSDALAAHLRRAGVRPDQPVAVCVERSLDMVVALLGIAKSGAAWLPLDPRFPADRLAYMLEDSRAALVLTQSAFLPAVRAMATAAGPGRITALALDAPLDTPLEAGADPATEPADPDHLAYVIYTSGSTGLPKGVMVPHRALTNFLCSMATQPGMTAGERLLAVTTYCFDIAVLELFLPLVTGGCCCICPTEAVNDAAALRDEIRRLRPGIMQATPATWTMLFHAGWRNEEGVRILCGGEPLPLELKAQLVAGGGEVWNMFGPTETTIWSTLASVTGGDAAISIGRPIANTQVHILDRYGRLAPPGLPGELCIGGDGLARGYLNRPELTAEKFIANPFAPGTRLYRTGDLARWTADGVLEHLGRLDHQVKIRGYRVELEEIEAWLDRHPAVRESVVVARDRQGGKQLVAYYVAAPGLERPPSQAQLKAHLAGHLPDYMVPAACVALAELPLTPNGKKDRKALQARTPAVEREEAARAPETGLEREVLAIWRALLNLDAIGVTDGFFALGGDSVTSVILAQRISAAFGVPFRAPDLFKHATVREISAHIAEARGRAAPKSAPAQTAPNRRPDPAPGAGSLPDHYRDSLAIVGISCHLPGAADVAEFWENLRQGRESSRRLSEEELRRAGVPDDVIRHPDFVPLQYSMDGKDLFDPGFFNISPKNAVFMDPQFRLLLQHSWQAIEDAGYVPGAIPDTAVFMSASNGFYKTLLHNSGIVEAADEYAAWIAGQGGTIPTMVSYQLGLKGPSFAVHSNCSSSLVGLYLARQAILAGEARCALVGAATLFPIPGAGHLHLPGMNVSSDGHCRAFDAAADGLVGGEGVVVVMVKRAADAVADGDHIHALVRGVAVNNDGADKAGFYAPSVKGQAAVIRKVLTATGVDPHSIGYVEAHGTGTRLGDPVEVMALNEAYGADADHRRFRGIGSVKPNIGHLDTAAGLAGLVKVALCLKHGEIPPSINYTTPNPEIDFASSAFRVVDRLTAWPDDGGPRRAALSSFGIGGTNAHAILEEYRPPRPAMGAAGGQVIVLSARTEAQVRAYAGLLARRVRADAGLDLGDAAFTLQTGRKPMPWRVAVVTDGPDALADRLERIAAGAAAVEGCFQGHAARGGGGALDVSDAEDGNHLVSLWRARGRLDKIARAWVGGMAFDWAVLHDGRAGRRVSLPTYPFAGERYWIDTVPAVEPVVDLPASPLAGVLLARPAWTRQPVADAATAPAYERKLVFLCDAAAGMLAALAARLPDCDCVALRPEEDTAGLRYQSVCAQLFERIRPLAADARRTLVQVVVAGAGEQRLYAGLSGLLKTVRLENPRVVAQLVDIGGAADAAMVAALLAGNGRCPEDAEVRYDGTCRMVPGWAVLPADRTPAAVPWRERGVYLLTGGAGALGLAFAEDIAGTVKGATLVLLNRSEPTAAQRRRIDALRAGGATVVCRTGDVSRPRDVDAVVADMLRDHGTIHGVLHCAGVLRDGYLVKKTMGELEAVLAAKVAGTVNLDRATRDVALDVFVLFSSAAVVHGSAGQADYCAANAFLDAFARHRNGQAAAGRRHGHTLSVDWPLMQAGGMRPDAAAEQAMREATGLVPMAAATAIGALYRCLALRLTQALV
ncbi:MAG TPA: amino acid adenylation domain-containing protein, partial [Azospirillum sp.]